MVGFTPDPVRKASNRSMRPTASPRYKFRVFATTPWISDALPFGRLSYAEPDAVGNAVDYAKFFSRLYDAVILVYDDASTVIETHEHTGEFGEI